MKRFSVFIAVFIGMALAFGSGYLISAEKPRIDFKSVRSPAELTLILNAIDTEIDALRTLANEIRTDHGTFITAISSLQDALSGDSLLSEPGLAEGTNHTGPATGQVYFLVNGSLYEKAAVAAGTALSGDNLPKDKYGAWAVDIGADGTIDIGEATGNATGYDAEAAAIAAIPAIAADHVRLGYLSVYSDSGGFTPGTSVLNTTGLVDKYYDGSPVFISLSAPPATLTAPAVTEQVTRGK